MSFKNHREISLKLPPLKQEESEPLPKFEGLAEDIAKFAELKGIMPDLLRGDKPILFSINALDYSKLNADSPAPFSSSCLIYLTYNFGRGFRFIFAQNNEEFVTSFVVNNGGKVVRYNERQLLNNPDKPNQIIVSGKKFVVQNPDSINNIEEYAQQKASQLFLTFENLGEKVEHEFPKFLGSDRQK